MYNLNVNVATTAGTAVNNLLAVESACTTPRTPEILNSLIAMTNPLDSYSFSGEHKAAAGSGSGSGAGPGSGSGSGCAQAISNDSNSSSCSQADTPTTSPPSIQHTCSQLIKAGLKLSIESKRKMSGDNDDFLDLDVSTKRVKKSECEDDGDRSRSPNQGLTPEDEERRRRRRERNKIAATKCRLKKREKTVNLVHESEILETQNIDLKTQIHELENQRRRLVDMLSMHTPSCIKHTNNSDHYNQQRDGRYIVNDLDNQNYSPEGPLPPVTSLSPSVMETSHVYNRPASVDVGSPFRSPNLEVYNRPASVGTGEQTYCRSVQYGKPPTIVVEGDNNYSPPSHFTNLDSADNSYHYNTQQCHNYNSPSGNNQSYGSPNMDNGCMA